MSSEHASKERNFVWVRYRDAKSKHERQRLLIAARKAVGTEPGSAPQVWPLYTSVDKDSIAAEHAAAGIWGTHQQGAAPIQVHVSRTEESPWPTNFGGSCRRLFNAQYSSNAQARSPLDTLAEDTISKRLAVLSRTDEADVAVGHITSLVRLMRSTGTPIAFNYDDLYWTLRNWEDLEKRTAAMYRWSRSYFHTTEPQSAKSVSAKG